MPSDMYAVTEFSARTQFDENKIVRILGKMADDAGITQQDVVDGLADAKFAAHVDTMADAEIITGFRNILKSMTSFPG